MKMNKMIFVAPIVLLLFLGGVIVYIQMGMNPDLKSFLAPAAQRPQTPIDTSELDSKEIIALEQSLNDALSASARHAAARDELKKKVTDLQVAYDAMLFVNRNLDRENRRLAQKEKELEVTVAKIAADQDSIQKLKDELAVQTTHIEAQKEELRKLTRENEQIKERSNASRLENELKRYKDKLLAAQDSLNAASQQLAKVVKENNQLRSDGARLHYNLGFMLFKKHDYGRALEEFKRCLALDPKNADAYYNAAVIYDEYFGDYALALESYAKYLECNPRAPDRLAVSERILQSRLRQRARVDSPLEERFGPKR